MTSTPRNFQRRTVEAALACLKGEGSRRFLVADEVGLGKTTVAREIVRQLSRDGAKKFTVYYICSNTRVSDQNASRLVDFLGNMEKKAAARSHADRLSMIPLYPSTNSPLRLYSLAPLTSFPSLKSRPSSGSALERAFISLLLEKCIPGINLKLKPDFMQQRAQMGWHRALQKAANLMEDVEPKLIDAYYKALRSAFGQGLQRKIVQASTETPASRTLTMLRRLLAEACLIGMPPDLIIFDEFQRFRDLLHPKPDDQLGNALMGRGKRRPAMLLLSATPYRLYSDSWSGKDGPRAHEELYETIEFLTRSKEIREQAQELFQSFGEILRAIGDADGDAVDPDLKAKAQSQRLQIETLLRPHISRSERLAADSPQNGKTLRRPLAIQSPDIKIHAHFADGLKANKWAATPYWLSVPLPAQSLGARYKIVAGAKFQREKGVAELKSVGRSSGGKFGWGSPKLRELQAINPASSLALPWVAPSICWWPLEGAWAKESPHKTLLFSRFKATPSSIAALLSLGVEDRYLDQSGRKRAWDNNRLKASLPVLALFHPSPFLIREIEPLRSRTGSTQALTSVKNQLETALARYEITVIRSPKKFAKRARPLWTVMAEIENVTGDFAATQAAWQHAACSEAMLSKLIADRRDGLFDSGMAKPRTISEAEFERLALHAFSSPAIAAGRAWFRHYKGGVSAPGLLSLTHFCWNRLRPYLDNRVFWKRLGKGRPVDILLDAVRQGGFESVLDEHFWLARGQTGSEQLIDELGSALHPSLGRASFKTLGSDPRIIRLRCHAAVPFSGAEGGEKGAAQIIDDPAVDAQPRSEGLRRAFNTPFWPHVLATTSVGQEGLDFHSWCRRIVHWDLPSNPVDLEQREGRISRYGGLLVRRPLGMQLRKAALRGAKQGKSPWEVAQSLAEEDFGDDKGLAPWWSFPDADITRHMLALSKSRDNRRFDHLQRQRLLYRLALGQPNQEDLINHLARGSDAKIAELAKLALDLSPRQPRI